MLYWVFWFGVAGAGMALVRFYGRSWRSVARALRESEHRHPSPPGPSGVERPVPVPDRRPAAVRRS